MIGVRSVGDDLAALHVLTFFHDRLLVHTRAGVRAHEFAQFVNMNARLRIGLQFLAPFRHVTVFCHHNLIGRDRSNFSAIGRNQNRVRIARDLALKTGADQRRFVHNQRHALALHV